MNKYAIYTKIHLIPVKNILILLNDRYLTEVILKISSFILISTKTRKEINRLHLGKSKC